MKQKGKQNMPHKMQSGMRVGQKEGLGSESSRPGGKQKGG